MEDLCCWTPWDVLELLQEWSNNSFHIYSISSQRISSPLQKINSAWSVGQLIANVVYLVYEKRKVWKFQVMRSKVRGRSISELGEKVTIRVPSSENWTKGWSLEPGFLFFCQQLLWITLRCNYVSLCLGHLLKLIDYLRISAHILNWASFWSSLWGGNSFGRHSSLCSSNT